MSELALELKLVRYDCVEINSVEELVAQFQLSHLCSNSAQYGNFARVLLCYKIGEQTLHQIRLTEVAAVVQAVEYTLLFCVELTYFRLYKKLSERVGHETEFQELLYKF